MPEWNVIAVNKLGFPRERHHEFQVESATIGEALKIAAQLLEGDETKSEWKISSLWWLNPARVKKEVG